MILQAYIDQFSLSLLKILNLHFLMILNAHWTIFLTLLDIFNFQFFTILQAYIDQFSLSLLKILNFHFLIILQNKIRFSKVPTFPV